MVVPNAAVSYPISSAGTQVVNDVLSKLLTVGITDQGNLLIVLFKSLRRIWCKQTATKLIYELNLSYKKKKSYFLIIA